MKSTISAGAADSVGQFAGWMDLACSILETIGSHSVRWRADEYEEFRQALAATLDVLLTQPSASSLLMYAGTLSERIEHYQRNTQQLIEGSVSGLNDIIRVLMSSTVELHANIADSAVELHEIEVIIQSARTAEELHATKAHLVNALRRLRVQTLEREQAASKLLASFQEPAAILERSFGAGTQQLGAVALKPSASPAVPSRERVETADGAETTGRVEITGRAPAWDATSSKSGFDALTGLPGQQEAEAAILGLRPADLPQSYIAAFHVKRMEAVHARFGEKLADDVLLFCAQQIARQAGASEDNLFRWRGPRFVAILKRETFLGDVRQELGRALGSKMTFEARNGSVLLPMTISTHVMHAAAHNSAELMERLERFFASQD